MKVELHAYLPRRDIESLLSRLIPEMEALGFLASLRAEGYAFLPAGLPVPTHIRAGINEGAISIWVRGAGELPESARMLGMDPEEYFENLMRGLRRAGDILRGFSGRGMVQISIPET